MVTFEAVRRGEVSLRRRPARAVPTQAAREARPQVHRILRAPKIQPKFTVGPPSDEFEQEADRVADQVMRMPDPIAAAAAGPAGRIQRTCSESEKEEKRLRRSPAKEAGWTGAEQEGLQGFNKDVTTVDVTGKIHEGKKVTKDVKGVWRVPIEGLGHRFQDPETKSGRAVVLIPNTVSPAAAIVDVLLHLHGLGAGYLELQPGKKDYGEILAPGQVRDVELYKMEQQLQSHVEERAKASKPPLIAVLPQGSASSEFGDLGRESDAYLKDVFTKLSDLKFLPDKASPGRIIVSGHSGGGLTAMTMATRRTQAKNRTDVLLFDAINYSCDEKEAVTDRRGNTKKQCKENSPCSSREYGTVTKWVKNAITADMKTLEAEQPADKTQLSQLLGERGTRFRGFTKNALDDTNTCSYGHWYGKLKEDIAKTIADLTFKRDVSAEMRTAIRNELHENYQVRQVKGLEQYKNVMERHERIMGHADLVATTLDEFAGIPKTTGQTPKSTPATPQRLQRAVAPRAATAWRSVLQRQVFHQPSVTVRSPVAEEAVTQFTELETKRPLRRDERELARSVFGDSIDYDRVRLIPTSILEFVTQPNAIRIPENFTLASEYHAQTFIHEMTHVWQYQHGGTSYMSVSLGTQLAATAKRGSRNFAYDYQIRPGQTFFDFTPEQQGLMVENYFSMLRDRAAIPRHQAMGATRSYDSNHMAASGFPASLSATDRLNEISQELPLHEPLIRQMRAVLPRPDVDLLQQRAAEVMQTPGVGAIPVPAERQLIPVKPILEITF